MIRFTIRDLLWATVVVALGVAWWIDRRSLTNQVARLKAGQYMSRAVDGID
jgi:hypothetical protein